MDKVNIETAKIAIIGSTKLTERLVNYLEKINRPKIIFGLNKKNLSNKVNAFDFGDYCQNKQIEFINNESWNTFTKSCEKEKINLIIEFGDSRIIPKEITKKYFIIGNHGAILPNIKGGASLVWGRMCNTLDWGISIFRVSEKIDEGQILNISKFNYENNTTMEEFVSIADSKTVECLIDYFSGKNLKSIETKSSDYKLPLNCDSYEAVLLAIECLKKNKSIYLPRRTIENCKINKKWPESFIKIFKISNNIPYPKYYY